MTTSPILRQFALGPGVWPTLDPFLFCVHHVDHYPAGNGKFGPNASLQGRSIGADFSGKDGWSMYHGEDVPGFPGHPHRGFETVTVMRSGYVDHADSLGAAARYGQGDVQWLTAGRGVVHSETFPLLREDAPNPAELFQIWLNLPGASKLADPAFTMFWSGDIPELAAKDDAGRTTHVRVVAGALDGAGRPLAPPKDSWASRENADVAIWTIRMEPGARWTLPPSQGAGTRRVLYLFRGAGQVAGTQVADATGLELTASASVELVAGSEGAELLLLQGRPIGEPVAQHGPFVMNTQEQVMQAFRDYQRTQFGGWPWDTPAPVHGPEIKRFARHPDGRVETP
ncbi:pirin family protein [Ramlibacter algicola]|uniref:Pirin family protein n=1 Tax=Ramlibacter algicola TaxID=2795217 RepID=A0A934Q2K2_9BURK|nr:pirin-like C-terminal cupin domain-containing protein [Ramlibacter algicola]MBK0393958.1 pirin family protein [Ramlibacter algicola]